MRREEEGEEDEKERGGEMRRKEGMRMGKRVGEEEGVDDTCSYE